MSASGGAASAALKKFDEDIKSANEKRAKNQPDAELHCALVALSPLGVAVSNIVQLVLMTSSGVRIYVQTVKAAATNPQARPVDIRPLCALPPPPASDGKRLTCMRGSVLTAGGVTLLASGVEDAQQGGGELLCLTDLPINRPLGSSAPPSDQCMLSRLRLQGAVLALAEEGGRGADASPPQSYEMVEQHSGVVRSFVVLTSDGVQRLLKRRPVDELLQASHAALPTLHAGLSSPVDAFFDRYGPDEGCAMCLLAALTHPTDANLAAQLAGWASALGGSASTANQSAAALPQHGQSATAQGQAIRLPMPSFSGRHGGITRVLARLLSVHWTKTIAVEVVGGMSDGLMGSVPRGAVELRMRVPSESWRAVQHALAALVAHLDTYAAQWGRSAQAPADAAQAAGAGGGSAGGAALRHSLYGAESAAARDKLWGNVAAHSAAREAEAIDHLVAFAKRAAETCAFLATLAPAARGAVAPAAAGNGHATNGVTPAMSEPPRLRLLQRLSCKLDKKLLETLKKLTLGELILPLLKDGSGRPLPGKWDPAVEVALPKALFMELGSASEGGGALTAELQRHCPTFFSSADQASLKGWSLLARASAVTTSNDQKTELLAQAVQTFTAVVGHIDLPKVLTTLLTHRAALVSSPAASAAIATIDRGIADLPLAAARAADPTSQASALLISPTGGAAPSSVAEWPAKLKAILSTKLRCYCLLLAKIDLLAPPPPPAAAAANAPAGAPPPASAAAAAGAPAAAAAAASGGDDGAWLRVLAHALRVEPSDPLFHHAAFLHLLHTKRDAVLLRLPSAHLLTFVTSPPLSAAARTVWSRVVALRSPEELTSLETLLSLAPSPGWPTLESHLASGELLPRLHFENERFVEAAIAFSELAGRPDPTAPSPPSASATSPLPPPPAAILQQVAATTTREALHARQRSLEVRISHISMALHAAAGGGGASSAGLGADFVRALEENAQRGQLQLRLATELSSLISSDGGLLALLPSLPEHAGDASSLKAALAVFHGQVCGSLLDLNALFKGAWAAKLWWPLLAILDFAQPYREYPQCITVAIQSLLAQPPEVWANGAASEGGAAQQGMTRPWAELCREVSDLRRSFTSEYVFQADAIVACLEAQQLAQVRPEAGAVVRMLCSRHSTVARPPVPWASLYHCYGSSERCGPLMKALWEGQRPALGSAGKQKLHLVNGLAYLLTEWLEESRGPTADRSELSAFAAAQRQLGVASDLEKWIAELDGIEALLGDNRQLAQNADLLRRQLRRLLHELAAIGHL